jgi:hypothetical protein
VKTLQLIPILLLGALASCKTTSTSVRPQDPKKKGLEARLLDVDPDKQFEFGNVKSFKGNAGGLERKQFERGQDGYEKKSFDGSKDFSTTEYSPEAYKTSNFYQADTSARLPEEISYDSAAESNRVFGESGKGFEERDESIPYKADSGAAKAQEEAERPFAPSGANSAPLSEEDVRSLLNKGKDLP